MGDGGSGGDPENRAQNLKSRLGKLLRINPTRTGSAWQIVGFGLRNPWRFSFDRANGNLWIGDVGQGSWEEVDYRNAARVGKLANYGWSRYEGKAVYDSHKPLVRKGDLIFPQLVYSHREGCSITGGYVYRGSAVPAAQGRYFYGDYCSGTIWSFPAGNGKTGAARVDGQDRPALVVRRGRQRRALRDVARRLVYRLRCRTLSRLRPSALQQAPGSRSALPAPLGSARAAAPHLRRLLPERGVGERLQRLVERRELARQPEEVLVVVGARFSFASSSPIRSSRSSRTSKRRSERSCAPCCSF